MSAYQRLDMRQGQSLMMTPQLQQAIKLLQLSNIELAEFVAEEIERNPLLERSENGGLNEPAPESDVDKSKGRDELALDGSEGMANARDAVDASDSDMYEAGTGSDEARTANSQVSGPSASTDWSTVGSGRGGGEDFDFEGSLTSEKSLHQHLHDQLSMAGLSQADSLIGARLIDETDDSGFCKVEIHEVAKALGADSANVEAVLHVCQGFDPTGVMARDLTECLALQLKEQDRLDPVMQTFLENLHLVAKHDIKGLGEACGVDKEDVMDMIAELRSLSPRPASGFATEATIAVAPDVFVKEMPNGMFAVELNSETLPRVLMDKAYYAEVSALPMRDKEKEFISECASNATWLIKSLDQRARTILKVASEIVRQQDAFFAHGVAHLRPLNLKQVADAIEMHESTVSRVTSNKYMATPRGLFELKYFFSAAIPSTGGGEAHSAEAVRYRIKQLIEDEGEKVLSDDKIVEILTEFGIEIARRTVAKYRESLGIPSSVQRRRVLKASA
ncbi:MAG: RNA polymerase factor sigma-54 [Henriciella sp.]|nr:RNA polymerase factor sigma-54 [Henriciella sp.]MBO6695295.1 RNA polymerase factor sigma-54 [Henriciella sp.]